MRNGNGDLIVAMYIRSEFSSRLYFSAPLVLFQPFIISHHKKQEKGSDGDFVSSARISLIFGSAGFSAIKSQVLIFHFSALCKYQRS